MIAVDPHAIFLSDTLEPRRRFTKGSSERAATDDQPPGSTRRTDDDVDALALLRRPRHEAYVSLLARDTAPVHPAFRQPVFNRPRPQRGRIGDGLRPFRVQVFDRD